MRKGTLRRSRALALGAGAAVCMLVPGTRVVATSNAWTTMAPLPGGARDSLAAATGPDGRIYAIGGYDGSTHLNRVEAYDVATNTWSTEASLPGVGRGNLPAATGPDGRIYAIGGLSDTGPVSEVDAYDTTTNTWTTVASMPGGARSDFAAATGPDGRIYAIGGNDGSNILSRVEAYDTTTNTWTTEAPMPGGPREDLVAAMGPDGRIYAIGGDTGTCTSLSTVEAYDTITNTWTTLASMPGGARSNMAGAAGPDGRIYAIGGANCSAYLSRVEGFNASSNTWTTGQDVPTTLQFEAVATGPDGRIYAIGGYNGARFATVEAYTVIGGHLTASGGILSGSEGAVFTRTVAAFSDADENTTAANYTATIDWGDTSTSAGTVLASSGGFTVIGTHAYAEEGTYTVTVSISDLDSNSVVATGTVTVADAALTAAGRHVPIFNHAVSGVIATFTDADPAGTMTDYTATIKWGDGTSSTGTVAASGGGFTVSGSHTYAKGVTKATVTVIIHDAGGSQAKAKSVAKL